MRSNKYSYLTQENSESNVPTLYRLRTHCDSRIERHIEWLRNNKVINGVEYGRYGLLNADDKKNPDIHYEVIWGNVIWGAVLVETIIAPIYFFGFDVFEPVGPKTNIKERVTHNA